MVKSTAGELSLWSLVLLIGCCFKFTFAQPISWPLFAKLGVDVNVDGASGDGLRDKEPPMPSITVTGENSEEPPPPVAAVAPLSPPPQWGNYSPFKPSIAVIIAVLTTMFSVTFLLLLYAKHCKRENGVVGYFGDWTNDARAGVTAVTARKNSGVERSVIESLPVFRFGSLTGQKEALECAVCLNWFEPVEVLRLLPKCKHAFHVECVDTWLDAHSTCPLCRYRVDPEDILLVETNQPVRLHQQERDDTASTGSVWKSLPESTRRVSGRHSYAGEWNRAAVPTPAFRRSDSGLSYLRTKSESVAVGCFDRQRKDGLLITSARTGSDSHRKLDHRIIISDETEGSGDRERWSDLQPSDILYLRCESVMNDGRRSWSSNGGQALQRGNHHRVRAQQNSFIDGDRLDDRIVMDGRSVSEITGLSRLSNSRAIATSIAQSERRAGFVPRWTAWISQSTPAGRWERSIVT
ncbi:hypothetical protein Nepgr_015461 [Nepenthes gracilis]|uniref:RING-type E3 ubiquitin transferase n=1 Tax=Nepenthes gracilis TaxID=150966 RepID=A0AAD3XRJ8_NEPGR|nr:hypothetical protein Nepgr_015461 [Nepenthes gracilis]